MANWPVSSAGSRTESWELRFFWDNFRTDNDYDTKTSHQSLVMLYSSIKIQLIAQEFCQNSAFSKSPCCCPVCRPVKRLGITEALVIGLYALNPCCSQEKEILFYSLKGAWFMSGLNCMSPQARLGLGFNVTGQLGLSVILNNWGFLCFNDHDTDSFTIIPVHTKLWHNKWQYALRIESILGILQHHNTCTIWFKTWLHNVSLYFVNIIYSLNFNHCFLFGI